MAMSFTDFLLRPSRTTGAAQSAGQSGNMAAPNAGAVANALPLPDVSVGGIPPELAALLGNAGGVPPPSAAPAPQQGIDPQAEAEAMALRELMGVLPQMLGPEIIPPDPMTPQMVGAPSTPAAAPAPQKMGMGFDPQFRARFFESNGRFPAVLDYKADSLSRDIMARTGRTPTKAELIAELSRPRAQAGISEFGPPVM